MKPIQVIKTIIKIILILPVIKAGVKSIIQAYKDKNVPTSLDDLISG